MLNDSLVYAIFKNIAQRHDDNPYLRLNSFAVIYDYAEFNTENFGKNHNDAKNGHYWTRSGVTFDDNKKDYGVLFIQKTSGQKNINGEYCHSYNVGVAFPEGCTYCPEAYRLTREQASNHAENVVNGVINEFLSYNGYSINIDGDKSVQWLNAAQNKPDGSCYVGNIESRLTNNISVSYDSFGVDKLQAAYVQIRLCGCFSYPEIKFKAEYDNQEKINSNLICRNCL